mgnify:CR=1 FL=1
MTTDRCPTCDREIAGADSIGEGKCEVQVSFDSKQRRAGGWNLQANRDCAAYAAARLERDRAAAARWRKVAPLIERLADDVRRRELIARAEFDRRIIDTVTNLLAATRETTP